MGLIKRVIFLIIPIATLLMALSFGIATIFATEAVTYITYNAQGQQIYDWNAYLNGLNGIGLLDPIKNLIKSIEGIINPIKAIIDRINGGYRLGDITKSIVNVLTAIVNGIAFVINSALSILQMVIILLMKLFSLIGVRTNGNLDFFKALNYIQTQPLIPAIPTWK